MKEEYKNYSIFLNSPIELEEGGFVVRCQISFKNGKPINAFDLEFKNIKTKEVATELALSDARNYIDENLLAT